LWRGGGGGKPWPADLGGLYLAPATVRMTATFDQPADSAPAGAPPGGSNGPLRVGLVGAGKMALNHARAVGRAGGRLVAVADPSEAARRSVLEIAPGTAAFDSLGAMLSRQALDVVHVCSPPATHRALAGQALEAGAHVYVEKPFAESAREAGELLELAAARRLRVCAGHQLLFEPPTRAALALLPALGRLAHVESYFSFRTVRRSPGGRAPLRPDLQLLDILPHPVYLLLHLLDAASAANPELVALDVGERGTVHALVRAGEVTGSLVVTLEGRPVESYVRLSGTNGSVFADYVRSTVQRQIGPGTSGIDKVLAPYRQAGQLLWGTTMALSRRVLKRQRSYPGLAELFEAFYRAVRDGSAGPVSPESILATTRIWEQVKLALERQARPSAANPALTGPRVVVTGGTGFLGRALVRTLVSQGKKVRVLARREPASWEQVGGAEYLVADLGEPLDRGLLQETHTVIHTAAETAGSWADHQRNSLEATEHLLRAAAAAAVTRVIHVSSLAVLAAPRGGGPIADDSPLRTDGRTAGPYVWGKVESERLARKLGQELGLAVKVVRPGALVDYTEFEPPGRLGKRIGNVFVAVGSPGDRLGIADVDFAARFLCWIADHFDRAPDNLNLIAPLLPTKRDLLLRLRRGNPDLTIVWLPRVVLVPLSWTMLLLQKLLRPGQPAVSLARVFAVQRYDTGRIAALAAEIQA
jgi:predicted dehydrogenase/nucleoside-diphosphate-sugar epimerase